MRKSETENLQRRNLMQRQATVTIWKGAVYNPRIAISSLCQTVIAEGYKLLIFLIFNGTWQNLFSKFCYCRDDYIIATAELQAVAEQVTEVKGAEAV